MVTSGGMCASCGTPLAPEASFMTELGEMCGQCFPRYQNKLAARQSEAADLDRSLLWRAVLIGIVHGLIWSVVFPVTVEAVRLPREINVTLLLADFALTLG